MDIFNGFVRLSNNGRLVKPAYIVTDFSFALIHSCIRSFNEMSLLEYLRRCYAVLMGKLTSSEITSVTYIVLCCAHMMKAMSSRLKKVQNDLKQRQAVLVWFRGLQTVTDMNTAVTVYADLCIVLNTKTEIPAVTAARQRLRQTCTGTSDVEPQEEDTSPDGLPDIVSENEALSQTTLKAASPFTAVFKTAVQHIMTEVIL